MISCKICGASVKRIVTSGHLRKHGITLQQYLELHPGADTISVEYRKALVEAGNDPEVSMRRSESLKAAHARPDVMERHAEGRKKGWNNEARREASRLRGKASMADPQKILAMYELARAPEARAKKSASLKGKIAGEKHWNWKGQKTPDWYWDRGGYKFKSETAPRIRERDGFKCLDCGMSQDESLSIGWGLLSVHHDDGNDSNNSDNNLVTLCRSCHSSRHNPPGIQFG